jgi:hypothetical protein
MKFGNIVDLLQNQIINVVLHKVTTAARPSAPLSGQLIYDTTINAIMYWDGSAWVDISGDIESVGAGEGLSNSGTDTAPILNINVDSSSIEIVGDIVRIKDLGVSTAKIADAAVTTNKIADAAITTIKVVDKNITFSKVQDLPTMTVIGRVEAGTGQASNITIINDNSMSSASGTTIATSGSIKAYVDATISGLGILIGGVDANTSTNFPTAPEGTTKGDFWYVTVAGTIQGQKFNVGDVMIASVNAASVTIASQWIFLETNREQASTTVLGLVTLATAAEVQAGVDSLKVITSATLADRTATESRTGIASIATTEEAQAGTENTKIITALKLKTVLDARTGGYATDLTSSAVQYIVLHSLDTKDVTIALYEIASGQEVYTNMTVTDNNSITVDFSVAPLANFYRVVIKK